MVPCQKLTSGRSLPVPQPTATTFKSTAGTKAHPHPEPIRRWGREKKWQGGTAALPPFFAQHVPPGGINFSPYLPGVIISRLTRARHFGFFGGTFDC